ncbi:MAG: glycosyltransferase [Armatimonadota bacterium]
MRILFVVEHFPSISETFVLNQITGLLDRGHEVEIYAIGKPDTTAIHPEVTQYDLMSRCWQTVSIPPSRIRRVLGALVLLGRHFFRAPLPLLRSLNVVKYGKLAASLYLFYTVVPCLLNGRRPYDIIHCHFGPKGVLAQYWKEMGAIRGRITTVFHAHELSTLTDEEGRVYYAPLLHGDTLLMPISDYWRQLLFYWGADPSRLVIHHMGVHCDRIPFRPRKIPVGEPINLLTVARLVESKGIEYALRALAYLQPALPNLRYTIVGDGPLRGELEALSQSLGLSDIVRFVGAQNQAGVALYLDQAHIFLSPHVTSHDRIKEGIPVALMEAMAAGVAVVTTRHSGIPELVEDGVSGLLADERDVAGLVTALQQICSDPAELPRLTRAARQMIEEQFNIERLNDALVTHFTRYAAGEQAQQDVIL